MNEWLFYEALIPPKFFFQENTHSKIIPVFFLYQGNLWTDSNNCLDEQYNDFLSVRGPT